MSDEYEIKTVGSFSAKMLETRCVSGCPEMYRIDDGHQDYETIKNALDSGDRSIIHCYHQLFGHNLKPKN